MIVDSSALLAILFDEDDHEPILDALLSAPGLIPAPVIVEYWRVAQGRGRERAPYAQRLIDAALEMDIAIAPFDDRDANLAAGANPDFGLGNGRGGKLNMLDLMVYGMAKARNMPILCTGKDFATTDAAIHPASRGW